ncbi:MAG TPA: carbohydrate ABC transporter permease [Tepidisphaeraceae bacterium]|jgi:ABC-type glycerol-3-phosphate transport system permease component|nr:carbohydrate ABC transporter permease [Tepidisphaeraceae bacterium]
MTGSGIPSSTTTSRTSAPLRWLIWPCLLVGSFVMLLPLAWMILTSLKTFPETLADPPTWIPAHFQWGNYLQAIHGFEFSRYFANSLFVTVGCIAGTLVSASLSAYALVAFKVRGKNIVFGLLLSTMMLPAQVTVIPLFRLYVGLHWINTFRPLIVPSWFGWDVFSIFLLRQFFVQIPRDYIEAARIDGASELRILLTVFVPLAKPALLTVAVFTFIGTWNDLWNPLLYLYDEKLYTLPLALMQFIAVAGTAQGTPWQLVMAIATIMMIPVVIVFFLAQKRFIEGISAAGIKG